MLIVPEILTSNPHACRDDSCVSENGTVPSYNFTAQCFFTSPAQAAVLDPAWWSAHGEPFVDALTAALPADTPGLLLWDVCNEPRLDWCGLRGVRVRVRGPGSYDG